MVLAIHGTLHAKAAFSCKVSDKMDVLVVGSCNIDLIAYISGLPGPGETKFGESFQSGFGGKGANQCVMAARLGAKVAMAGAVGDDGFGRDTVAHFKEESVDVSHLAVLPGVSSGVAPIWVDSNTGENSIIVVPGANGRVTAAAAAAAVAAHTPKSVLCQNEVPMEATAAALAAGRAAGATTFWSPAPAPKADTVPPAVYAATSVLLPNAVEAAQLAGVPSTGSPGEAAAVAAGHALLQRGGGAVVVTLGSRGSLVLVAGDAASDAVHVPACKVASVVDTTGAGDAFSGALSYFYALLNTSSGTSSGSSSSGGSAVNKGVLVEAVRRAAFVAADSVTKKGTQLSYAARAALPQQLFLQATEPGFAEWAAAALPTPAPAHL